MAGLIDVIVVSDASMSAEQKVKGAFPSFRSPQRSMHVSLESALIEHNMRDMINELGERLLAPTPPEQGFEIDEIELTLSVDAKGGVSLIGSVEIGGHAGIKVKLKRKADRE